MTGRVLVTVRCRRRGHLLAQLLATADGMVVSIPHIAAGHGKAGRVVNHRGGPMTAPLLDEDGEPSMSYPAMCAEGVHAIHARDLARAAAMRTEVITLSPVLQ